MYQQWLQVIGLVFDGLGFALIALEWYRGYVEMRNKVTLVARNQELAEKFRLRAELKQAIGSVGVGEVEVQWLEKKDWIFDKTFDVDENFLKSEKIDLILRGVDTYADVVLNDVVIQKTDNAFRTWRLEVKQLLKPKGNVLKFLFTSPLSKENFK